MKQLGTVSKVAMFCPTVKAVSLDIITPNFCIPLSPVVYGDDTALCLWLTKACSEGKVFITGREMRLIWPTL